MMRFFPTISLLILFVFGCTVESLPPLDEFEFIPDGVDIVHVDSVTKHNPGWDLQYVRIYYHTDFSSLSQEEFETFEQLVLYRDGEPFNDKLALDSDRYFGQQEYELGKTYTFGFGLLGRYGYTKPKAGTEITVTME